MKNFLIFLSILVLSLFAKAGNDRSECSTLCANSFNGSAIAQCFSKCRSSASYYDSLKSPGNSEDASAVSGQSQQHSVSTENGPCGPTSVDLGNSCAPKATYCTSPQCTMGNCSGCEGFNRDFDAVDPQASDPNCVKTDNGYVCDSRGTPQASGKRKCKDEEDAAVSGDCELAGAARSTPNEISAKGGCVGPGLEQQADGSCKNNITGEVTPADATTASFADDSKKDPETGISCTDAHTAASDSCNSESKSWMGSMNDVVKTLGPAVQQINPSTCGPLAAAQTGASGALATFEIMCNNAMKTCTSACTGSTIPQDVTNLADCKKIGTKASQASQSVANAMITLKGSVAQCQNAFGDMGQQATAYCASNPSACAFQALTPIGANSAQADQAGGLPNPGLGGDMGGTTGKGAAGLNMAALGDDANTGIGPINPSKAGEDPGGGKGGGHVGAGGGGQGGDAGGGRGGGKKEGILSNILSGFFGSGGSSGGGGGGFLSKIFGGGGGGGNSAADNPKAKVGPDLRQFLPGGLQDPTRNRGIAGQFIGRDGMSGPHSDIWKNINNRYQYKRASLLP